MNRRTVSTIVVVLVAVVAAAFLASSAVFNLPVSENKTLIIPTGDSVISPDVSGSNGKINRVINASSTDQMAPDAKMAADTGNLVLPNDAAAIIVFIPVESHHEIDEEISVSMTNPYYLPSNLTVPLGTEIFYIHGDPDHTHSTMINDTSGVAVWQSKFVPHPGMSDGFETTAPGVHVVTDHEYGSVMRGMLNVTGEQSTKHFVYGTMFFPTEMKDNITSTLSSNGISIISQHDFFSVATRDGDKGNTTLAIYSSNMTANETGQKLLPIVEMLPYR